MNTSIPESGSLEHPRLWRLALQIDRTALRAVVWSTVEEATLVQFALPLDPTLPLCRALEEAVYAAPVLLSDFLSVDVVVRTQAFMPCPADLDDESRESLLKYSCLTDGSDSLTVKHDSAGDADVAWVIDSDTSRFLARTFRNPATVCHITPLMRYFSRKSLMGNSGKLYAHFHQSTDGRTTDIICFGTDGRPALATSRVCRTDDDTLYYILAAARDAGLDLHNDELLLCGDAGVRDTMMPLLRRYAAVVMPVIFPSAALRSGHEALNAPFPLIILPLCE